MFSKPLHYANLQIRGEVVDIGLQLRILFPWKMQCILETEFRHFQDHKQLMSVLERKLRGQGRWVNTNHAAANTFAFSLRTRWNVQVHSDLGEQTNFYYLFLFLRRAGCLICFENLAILSLVPEGMRTHLLKPVQLMWHIFARRKYVTSCWLPCDFKLHSFSELCY